jgi:hypothetical protein
MQVVERNEGRLYGGKYGNMVYRFVPQPELQTNIPILGTLSVLSKHVRTKLSYE